VLTSLTTFAGLAPLLLERSVGAQFVIPMGVSLAFGVVFATVISLFLVPCGYLILEDIKRVIKPRAEAPPVEPTGPRPLHLQPSAEESVEVVGSA
jgi:predicted RND superfamily exporter protein